MRVAQLHAAHDGRAAAAAGAHLSLSRLARAGRRHCLYAAAAAAYVSCRRRLEPSRGSPRRRYLGAAAPAQ